MQPASSATMTLRIILLALVACAGATTISVEESPTVETSSAIETLTEDKFSKKPAVVVRKITYYEPELVAVVVERGVDDVPEDSVLIENYSDVLSPANKEILLCKKGPSKCVDKPIGKLLVPSPFKSLDVRSFLADSPELPWVSTLGKDKEVFNKPILVTRDELEPVITKSLAAEEKLPAPIFRKIASKPTPSERISFVPYTDEHEPLRTLHVSRPQAIPNPALFESFPAELPERRVYPISSIQGLHRPMHNPLEPSHRFSSLHDSFVPLHRSSDSSQHSADLGYFRSFAQPTSGLSYTSQPRMLEEVYRPHFEARRSPEIYAHKRSIYG